jgi:hypothetical protein
MLSSTQTLTTWVTRLSFARLLALVTVNPALRAVSNVKSIRCWGAMF